MLINSFIKSQYSFYWIWGEIMIDSCFTCVYAKVYPGRYATYYSPPEPPEAECTLDTEQTGITEELEDILQRNKAKLAEYCMCYQPLPESKYDV